MRSAIVSLLFTLRALLRDRAALQLEILALRHQLQVLERTRPGRVRLTRSDRLLWAWLSGVWRGWRVAVVIVKPETVLAWHRQGFRLLWTWKSRHRPGRPAVPSDVRALIRTMSEMNPLWGVPRIHGELLKLGIDVCEATVAKYMARGQRPPSQTWRTFLTNHIDQIAAADFFIVPTITYRLLFVLVILAHQRRRVTHVAVTAHPTAAWTAQQLREAFPEDTAPRYLIHDRDPAFAALTATTSGMGIEELRTAARSPWQNVCRAAHRLHPTRVPRSRDRRKRNRIGSRLESVPGVLPPIANASLAGEGLAAPSAALASALATEHSTAMIRTRPAQR
jgi:putative transposase